MAKPRRPSLAVAALGGTGLLLSLVSAALSLCACLGGLSDRLDLLANLAPVFAATGLFGLLLALPARGFRRPALALAAATVLGAGRLVLPEFLRSTGPSSAPGAHTIKVIQFNVWRANTRYADIAAWLQAEDPDFVLIEEASPALRDLIVRRTGWSVAGARTTSMIFSRRHYAVMHRPPELRNAGFTWVNATYVTDVGPVEVVVSHFERPNQTSARRQVDDMAGVLASLPRERMIFGGDFNETPWSAALRRADAAFGLFRRDRALASWPANGLRGAAVPALLPIDHVFAGPGLSTVDVRRGPALGSDHYPIVVRLAPRP